MCVLIHFETHIFIAIKTHTGIWFKTTSYVCCYFGIKTFQCFDHYAL